MKLSGKLNLGKGVGSKKIGKVRYPDKTSINLLPEDNEAKTTSLEIIAFVIFLIALAVFAKFMVIDQIYDAVKAESTYEQLQSNISSLQEANKDYDEIRKEYSHYGNGYMNDEEKLEQDRMYMMDIIDSKVLSKSDIQSLSISGNVASVTIDKIRLSTVSSIVSSLESSSIVSYVTVSTAGTGAESSNSAVTATLEIYFKDLGGEQ